MNSTFIKIAKMNATALEIFYYGYDENAVMILLDALRIIRSVTAESDQNVLSDNSVSSSNTSSANVCRSPNHCDRRYPATYESNSDHHELDKHPNNAHQFVNEQEHGCCKLSNHGVNSSSFSSSSPSSYAILPLNDGCDKNGRTYSRNLFDEIYNNAFLFTHDIPVAVAETAAVLSYNLALIVHREGLKNGKSVALMKALELYQQAYDLLGYTDEVLCYQSSSVLVILTAAICTNVTQIRNDLHMPCPHDNLITTDRLKELIMFMECEQYVHQQDLEFFEAAIFFLNLTSPIAAPAA